MGMVPIHGLLDEEVLQEIKIVAVLRGDEVPPGDYAFLEMYCDDPSCDCRRVLIEVRRPGHRKTLATIGFGFESEEYYRKFAFAPEHEIKGPILDPLNPQSNLAPVLLRMFEELVLPSPGYVERLKRHYDACKLAVGMDSDNTKSPGRKGSGKRKRRKRRAKRTK